MISNVIEFPHTTSPSVHTHTKLATPHTQLCGRLPPPPPPPPPCSPPPPPPCSPLLPRLARRLADSQRLVAVSRSLIAVSRLLAASLTAPLTLGGSSLSLDHLPPSLGRPSPSLSQSSLFLSWLSLPLGHSLLSVQCQQLLIAVSCMGPVVCSVDTPQYYSYLQALILG